MKIRNIRTFLPSIDFKVSKEFYKELGFDVLWENDELCMFGTVEYNFFLQDYYKKEWAENLMVQMFVDDLEDLYRTCEKVIPKYEACKLRPIFKADYGRTFHIIGPSGELWHMTEVEMEVEEHNKLLCETQ